eukprot:TRINITY_DN9724_c0_g1_i1.p1 TRINITY_DN9724_c0_g1~~TRINITY_DN9724_c0_g1_i1.p1  ORF type:complete len:227 (+),score=25.04 TRINITY_DN9724_c0_g1_i1:38-718(+)
MRRLSVQVRFFSLLSKAKPEVFHKSKTVPFPVETVFGVVADVAKYEEFLPYVSKSVVVSGKPYIPGTTEEARFSATLSVGFQLYSEGYTSDVVAIPYSEITSVALDSSTFSHLTSHWTFTRINGDSCQINFKLEHLASNTLFRLTAGQTISEVAECQVAAIETRCRQLSLESAARRTADREATTSETKVEDAFRSIRELAVQLGLSNHQIELAFKNSANAIKTSNS